MEKFLRILLKITKIFFFLSFSVSFVFPEIIDLENKDHLGKFILNLITTQSKYIKINNHY